MDDFDHDLPLTIHKAPHPLFGSVSTCPLPWCVVSCIYRCTYMQPAWVLLHCMACVFVVSGFLGRGFLSGIYNKYYYT